MCISVYGCGIDSPTCLHQRARAPSTTGPTNRVECRELGTISMWASLLHTHVLPENKEGCLLYRITVLGGKAWICSSLDLLMHSSAQRSCPLHVSPAVQERVQTSSADRMLPRFMRIRISAHKLPAGGQHACAHEQALMQRVHDRACPSHEREAELRHASDTGSTATLHPLANTGTGLCHSDRPRRC